MPQANEGEACGMFLQMHIEECTVVLIIWVRKSGQIRHTREMYLFAD